MGAERERHDRALRAANADRNEMQTSLSAMQEERRLMQSKLRQIAVKEDLAGEGRAGAMLPATSATRISTPRYLRCMACYDVLLPTYGRP